MLNTVNSSADVMTLLRSLEQYSRTHAAPLPQKEQRVERWSGIGFRMGNYYLLAPLGEAKEIMPVPKMSVIPGSKHWVKGIANVRGNLLPVFDLHHFLANKATPRLRQTRVLAVANEDLQAGLMVDEVFGLKHFDKASFDGRLSHDVPWANRLQGGFVDEHQINWIIIDFKKITADPAFLQVAA